jgi:thiol:disulfide interchange protein DsbC
MLEGTEPAAAAAECMDPIADIARLADEVGIQGTPGLVFSSGRLVPGAISAQEIEEHLNAPGKP